MSTLAGSGLNPIRHLLALVGARHIVHVSRIRVKSHPPFASIGRSSPYCPRRVRVKSSGKLASAIFEQSFRNLIAVLMSDLYLFRSFYIWHKETKSDLMAVVSSHTPSGQLYFFLAFGEKWTNFIESETSFK